MRLEILTAMTGHRSRRNRKPRMAVLTRTSSNLTDRLAAMIMKITVIWNIMLLTVKVEADLISENC
jgi:hypothetical protein